jgi:hypothetical protein
VTPASYSNGATTSFNTATPVTNPGATSTTSTSTSLSGDKIGASGHDIFSHNTSKFNPNVKIVVNKSTGKPVKPTEKTDETTTDIVAPEIVDEI